MTRWLTPQGRVVYRNHPWDGLVAYGRRDYAPQNMGDGWFIAGLALGLLINVAILAALVAVMVALFGLVIGLLIAAAGVALSHYRDQPAQAAKPGGDSP